MFDQGDFAENDVEAGIEVFRAAEPAANVWDVIVILKAHTNGTLDMKEPATLRDAWRNITEAIARSEQVESMVWKKLPEAKFGFKIFQDEIMDARNDVSAEGNRQSLGHHEGSIRVRMPSHRLRLVKDFWL